MDKNKDDSTESANEKYEDAQTKTEEDLVQKQADLRIFAEDDPDSNDDQETGDEQFVDCEEFLDEESQKDFEKTLTEEELQENKEKADKLKIEGNDLFKSEKYEESVKCYTEGLKICPIKCANERSILYSNRAAAKAKLNLQKSAIDDCSKAIEFNPNYVKALLRRANLYESLDKLDECLEDFKKINELDKSHAEARAALIRLPPIIAERNEKLKDEMLGKLKDLGNMFLKPFGLSTSNFQMQQDPSTGSYSVNFQQKNNPNT